MKIIRKLNIVLLLLVSVNCFNTQAPTIYFNSNPVLSLSQEVVSVKVYTNPTNKKVLVKLMPRGMVKLYVLNRNGDMLS